MMPIGRSPGVIRALAFTEERLADNLNFQNVAHETGQTPRTLARRLGIETGMTWGQILREMRMIRAIELLAGTADPVTEVAFGVGYQSISAFNAAFRAFTGQTPTDYRASFAKS
jgi:transcriptional regulator GlxA family with amidase domain